MDLGGLDLGELMADASSAGVTMMLKVDDQRLRTASKPWIAVLEELLSKVC